MSCSRATISDHLRAIDRSPAGPARRPAASYSVVGSAADASEAADRFAAHVFIGIGARNVRQHGDVVSLVTAARRTRASASSRASASQRVALIGAKVVDRRGTNRRIGVLPAGLRTEFLENAHCV